MDNSKTYQVVAGTRAVPGAVLATFSGLPGSHRSGGPATAALRAWDALSRRGVVCFFGKVAR